MGPSFPDPADGNLRFLYYYPKPRILIFKTHITSTVKSICRLLDL
jgi:hypothetical protein